MDASEFYTFLIGKLPNFYLVYDEDEELQKYISALCDSGYASIINGENSLLDLIDPYKCPEEILPMFCGSFGFDYYPNIPAKYHRKLLANIRELNRRRGTYYCVRFLCRALTGMEIDMSYDSNTQTLAIHLLANSLEAATSVDVSVQVVSLFIKDFLPYFVSTVVVDSVVTDTYLESPLYHAAFITQTEEVTLPTTYTF